MKVFKTKEDENTVRNYFLVLLFGILYVCFLDFFKFLINYGIISSGIYLTIIFVSTFLFRNLFEKLKKTRFYEKFLAKIPILLLLIVDILGLIFVNSKINF